MLFITFHSNNELIFRIIKYTTKVATVKSIFVNGAFASFEMRANVCD